MTFEQRQRSRKRQPRVLDVGDLRGGLQASADSRLITGLALGLAAEKAVETAAVRNARAAYRKRRAKSIPNRVRMKHLPAAEAGDVRYHECRACGWSPAVESIRVWFFDLGDDDRQELVVTARRQHVAYAKRLFDVATMERAGLLAHLSTVDRCAGGDRHRGVGG